jgi:hypothetical protein
MLEPFGVTFGRQYPVQHAGARVAVAQPIEGWAPDPPAVSVGEGATEDVDKRSSHSPSDSQRFHGVDVRTAPLLFGEPLDSIGSGA